MSDQEITYAVVRVHKSSSRLQSRGRADETQGPRDAGHRECSTPCHFVAIPLGILSFILLLAVAVLVIHILQCSKEKRELKKTLNNLHQEYSTMQNDSYLRKEMLRNESKKHLDSLNRNQNRCCRKIQHVLDCNQHTGQQVDMFCCGIKCYYFNLDKKCWNGCKETCQDCSLSLLKIDDDDELKCLQEQTNLENYWIGLSYDKRNNWQWIGAGSSKLDLSLKKLNHSTRRCAFLSRTRLEDDGCDRQYYCICEKRLHI